MARGRFAGRRGSANAPGAGEGQVRPAKRDVQPRAYRTYATASTRAVTKQIAREPVANDRSSALWCRHADRIRRRRLTFSICRWSVTGGMESDRRMPRRRRPDPPSDGGARPCGGRHASGCKQYPALHEPTHLCPDQPGPRLSPLRLAWIRWGVALLARILAAQKPIGRA